MSFDDDAVAQFTTISQNLEDCDQTLDDERKELRMVIADAVGAANPSALSLDDVDRLKSAVRDRVVLQSWYFRGAKGRTGASVLYNTRREDRVIKGLASQLARRDEDMLPDEAETIARTLVGQLSSDGTYVSERVTHASLPLHHHGSPLWLATLEESASHDPDQRGMLPGRLGLQPDADMPARYLLFSLQVDRTFRPRFADSAGYPYWLPGGVTKPIAQCPAGTNGHKEMVADGVTIANLRKPLAAYLRTV